MVKKLNHKIVWVASGLLAGMLWADGSFAQHEAYLNPVWKTREKADFDTNSLWHAFKAGKVAGHIRQFSMATINQGNGPDYFAAAVGAGIRYQSASFHRFQVTLSGFLIHNVHSSDLAKPDETTGALNRYETGLFDVTDRSNKNDLDRLEELHLSYQHKAWKLVFGKQIINTPFINPQDGRMRPTEVSGLWTTWQPATSKWSTDVAWLFQVSPRSTVRWYGIAESIGLYPQGVNPDGTKSDYANALHSRFILYQQVRYQVAAGRQVQLTNQLVEGIFNTSMLQANWQWPGAGGQWIGALQLTHQTALGHGGNTQPQHSYFEKGSDIQVVSGRFGWKNKKWQASLNATRIGKGSRFLMPREWGKEPFFTFLPRERNEGLGDLTAMMIKLTRQFSDDWTLDAGLGLYNLPSVTDYRHNKYGMPDYGQSNLALHHRFSGWLQGLEADLLWVYKWNRDNEITSIKQMVNKVNMSNLNLVFNYHF